MTSQPTTTFGATVLSKNYTEMTQTPLPALTPAVSHDSINPDFTHHNIPPCSPFYQHPPASHERVPKPASFKSQLDVNLAEKGLFHDDMTPISTNDNNPFSSTISVDANKECSMWPSRQTLVTTKMVEKKKKRSAKFWACANLRHSWDSLHKKHRLAVRLAIALVIIGAMIGIGVGISRAVHGSYYTKGGSTST